MNRRALHTMSAKNKLCVRKVVSVKTCYRISVDAGAFYFKTFVVMFCPDLKNNTKQM